MTVEQAAMVPQDTPARPTPELLRQEEEEEEVKQEDPPLAEERKPDREVLTIKEVKEKDAKRLPDRPASDHSSKVTSTDIKGAVAKMKSAHL